MSNKDVQKFVKKNEDGFTMVEAIVAILILTVGLIGTVAAITYALEFGTISRNVTSAKSVIVATIEEIETLRNARRLDFKQIANVGGVDNLNSANQFRGFSVGFNPVSLSPGSDGVSGTDDDISTAPGADGNYGTPDDVVDPSLIRSGFERQITITNLSNSLKKIEIKVKYFSTAGKVGEITGVSYLNNDARVTR